MSASSLRNVRRKVGRAGTSTENGRVLLGLLFLLLLAFGAFYWVRDQVTRPVAHTAQDRTISIVIGTSRQQILRQLRREGVLDTDWPLRLWLSLFDRRLVLKAGDYRFPTPISALQVLERMERGQVVTRSLTIPEGFNRYDIARLLAGLEGIAEPPVAQPSTLLPLFDRVSLIADLDPTAGNLEGYLFPDTYEYSATTTRAQLVEAMARRFRQVFTDQMRQRAGEMALSTRQVVTLASLVEKEAQLDRERELISAVFHRRLREGVPLGCDPTVIYAALLADRYRGKIYRSDLDRQSPYNTYLVQGLPPGPIASPGRRSLEATLSPAPVDYLYFVVDATRKDGSHVFSTTAASHEAAVRRLREAERTASR